MRIAQWWEPLWCKVMLIVASALLVSGIMTWREWQGTQRQQEIRAMMAEQEREIIAQQRQIYTQQQHILEAFRPFHTYHQKHIDAHQVLQEAATQCLRGVEALQEQRQWWTPAPR